jgi:hypothetical protein
MHFMHGGKRMENYKTFGVLKDIKNGEYRVVLTPAVFREGPGYALSGSWASKTGNSIPPRRQR